MADYSPNFVNPAYATPEQLATQRAYADALTKRAGENVNRPTGALANMITALTGNLERNRANEIQSQAAERNSADLAAIVRQLQNGQQPDAATQGRIYANPMASPEHRALIGALITPKPMEDVAGRPAFGSPSQGVKSAPVDAGFQPGIRPSMSTPDASISAVPQAAPPLRPPVPIPATPPGVTRLDPQAMQDWRRANPLPTPQAGGGGGEAPGAVLPTAPAPAMPLTLDALAAKGRELSAERERTQGGAKGESEIINKDINRAAAAPETLKGLGIMKNTIETVGDKMTFGPTARFSNEARRVISNYAPGLVDEKALAGADAVEKLNLGLAGNLSQSLGLNPSDIYRSVASVPGNEKSKAGTLALINMMEQAARNDQHVGTTLYQQNRGNLAGYQEARAAYYAAHPIINPITGNPVEIDAKKAASGPAAPAGTPAVGATHNGYRFRGGNPNDKNSWERI